MWLYKFHKIKLSNPFKKPCIVDALISLLKFVLVESSTQYFLYPNKQREMFKKVFHISCLNSLTVLCENWVISDNFYSCVQN